MYVHNYEYKFMCITHQSNIQQNAKGITNIHPKYMFIDIKHNKYTMC